MDFSPKLLREVEFREHWRGYRPDEVDDFLERLAVALEQLQAQLHDAKGRAVRAEERLLDSSGPEDEIRRTLVLAQRTADAARQEAEAESKKVVDEARAEARRLVAEARARAARVDREAREAARAELDQLVNARQGLARDVEALEAFLAARRSALRAVLEESQRMLEDPARLGPVPAPPLADVEVPEASPSELDDEDSPDATQGHPQARFQAERQPERQPEEPAGEEAVSAEPEALPEPEAAAQPAMNGGPEPPLEAERPMEPGGEDEDAWQSFAAARDDDDDPFLAELRRAVNDPEPLGPRDHERPEGERDGDVELYDQDLSPSSRFRLRRRR